MRMDRLRNASVQDVMRNPRYYGMPETMAEIKAFVERLKPKSDAQFASVDRGSNLLSGYVRSQRYFIEGPEGRVACGKSLEKVQETAKNMGLNWQELEPCPEVIPDAGLKCDIEVTFRPKSKIFMPGKA